MTNVVLPEDFVVILGGVFIKQAELMAFKLLYGLKVNMLTYWFGLKVPPPLLSQAYATNRR